MLPIFRTAARLARSRLPSSLAQATARRIPAKLPTRPFSKIANNTTNFSNITFKGRPCQPLQSSIHRTFLRGALLHWAARPTFALEVAGLIGSAGAFYVYHLERVPISNRLRFNIISPRAENQLGEWQYEQTMETYKEYILPESDPRVIQVRKVFERLLPNSGLPVTEEVLKRVTVIDQPDEVNAFVIPGGGLFVFTGMLSLCFDDDDVLAAVLGHEIGHNVARHIAESLSRDMFLLAVAWFVERVYNIPGTYSQRLVQQAIDRPKSRAQESEADRIGLMIMAKSCFDPRGAVTLWERMQILEEYYEAVPEEYSTHPSSCRRQVDLEALLPIAQQVSMEASCALP
ncbi:hypothetical protein ABW20_dc0102447 [Dactylellina cionopaga]|nr:hypothetical protein ABW20_dc0102447 [Dactylellina cionopaga]